MRFCQLVLLVFFAWASVVWTPVALAGQSDEIYRVNPTKDPAARFGVYIPEDLEDTFVELNRMLHPKLVERMQQGSEEDMSEYHMGLGMWIRNNWGLWGGSRLSRWFNERGICHPDDMSSIVLDSYWRRLHDQPLELEHQIKRYKKFWGTQDPCKER
jgi:hypothetical protein